MHARQLFQSLKTGEQKLLEIPRPKARPGHLVIANTTSLVSAGTERMLLDFGKSSLLGKARKQPEKVKQVLEKISTDGLVTTLEAVQRKLDEPIPLGYSSCGRVLEVGAGIDDFAVGDLVVSNGPHGDIVQVPRNLAAKVPEGVAPEHAAYTVVASIALQGIRLLNPTLGESVVVSGLGLIGQLSCMILRANGCRVLGFDFDEARVQRARELGVRAETLGEGVDPVALATEFSRGRGVDGVLITASTKSNEPIHQAALSCRKRGRIVLIGVIGLDLQRADFYEKELTFQVSCSYGPGRYDPEYEAKGKDYPLGFVRWTEQRNFEAVLDLMQSKVLDPSILTTHRFPFQDCDAAYETLSTDRKSLGIVLEYPEFEELAEVPRTIQFSSKVRGKDGTPGLAVVGAGNYTRATLLPALKGLPARFEAIVSRGGADASSLAQDFGFSQVSTDFDEVLQSKDVDAVLLTTRHDAHADQVVKCLDAGKHVFVEKPLAVDAEGMQKVRDALERAKGRGRVPALMVGFNRRFAPLITTMKDLLSGVREPPAIQITVNAGVIPQDHWVHDPRQGGRWIGEGCHFLDLARYLAESPIVQAQGMCMGEHPTVPVRGDRFLAQLRFESGAIASIQYLGNGDKGYPKERVEVFAGGRVLQLDNFRALHGWGWPSFRKEKLWGQDKGHAKGLRAFIECISKPDSELPIPLEELLEVGDVAIQTSQQAHAF